MGLSQRGRRSCVALIATVATTVATLTLVPALAQVNDEPAPEPYVELRSSTVRGEPVRPVRGWDAGDERSSAGLRQPHAVGPRQRARTPHGDVEGACSHGAGRHRLPRGGGTPIGALPPVTAAHYVLAPSAWVGPLPLIGVTSYTCAGGAQPSIVAEDAKAAIKPGETLAIGRGADLPLDFRRLN